MNEEINKVSLFKAGKQNQPSYRRGIIFNSCVHCSLLLLLVIWAWGGGYKLFFSQGEVTCASGSFGTLRFPFLCKQLPFTFNLPEGPGLSGLLPHPWCPDHCKGTKQSVPDFKPARTVFHLFLLKHLHNFPRASQIISDKAEI